MRPLFARVLIVHTPSISASLTVPFADFHHEIVFNSLDDTLNPSYNRATSTPFLAV